ncbi:MAG: RNA-binding transcriptional accessory protein, partial [Muribaculaceae bacterium]|nr:RNA-binding transcriptional accessory protein [Muribaculaceae bacterium]
MTTAEYIAQKLNIPLRNVENVISLLGEGATIPFISRYRKEATGSLDEVAIFEIEKESKRLEELATRKQYIISTIESQGKLTDELRQRINNSFDSAEIEDLYLPFKPKRRTRAQIAREKGLEPLADMILLNRRDFSDRNITKFVNTESGVNNPEEAIAGASDIIAERVSESQRVRAYVRGVYTRHAEIKVTPVKGKKDEAVNYENYFNFSSKLNRCSSHQVLAIMRGINEGLLKYDMSVDDDIVLDRLYSYYIKGNGSALACGIITDAIKDSYKRLIQPSMENEMLAAAKERADEAAIKNFADNLRQLLLAAPLGSKRVLAIDPGFRTGCKVVCLDANGNLLHNDVIYPTPTHNDIKASARKISNLVEAYDIDAISL